ISQAPLAARLSDQAGAPHPSPSPIKLAELAITMTKKMGRECVGVRLADDRKAAEATIEAVSLWYARMGIPSAWLISASSGKIFYRWQAKQSASEGAVAITW
ncbi:hypothetical protein MXD63_42695, partial [Frankia sp. Cpl3]|nr:hypothetical protein [Frankia sp. Cpl3]